MNSKNTTCKIVMNHICDSMGEELDSPKCEDIKKHLENCPNCKSYFKSMENTILFYKKYNVNLDNDGHKRLLDFLGLDEEE